MTACARCGSTDVKLTHRTRPFVHRRTLTGLLAVGLSGVNRDRRTDYVHCKACLHEEPIQASLAQSAPQARPRSNIGGAIIFAVLLFAAMCWAIKLGAESPDDIAQPKASSPSSKPPPFFKTHAKK